MALLVTAFPGSSGYPECAALATSTPNMMALTVCATSGTLETEISATSATAAAADVQETRPAAASRVWMLRILSLTDTAHRALLARLVTISMEHPAPDALITARTASVNYNAHNALPGSRSASLLSTDSVIPLVPQSVVMAVELTSNNATITTLPMAMAAVARAKLRMVGRVLEARQFRQVYAVNRFPRSL